MLPPLTTASGSLAAIGLALMVIAIVVAGRVRRQTATPRA